jgi:hypothetical protein
MNQLQGTYIMYILFKEGFYYPGRGVSYMDSYMTANLYMFIFIRFKLGMHMIHVRTYVSNVDTSCMYVHTQTYMYIWIAT